MQRRQITEAQVCLILKSPEQIIKGTRGRQIYQSKLWIKERQKEYLFRVVADLIPQPPEVITVYRTSKISKYWR